jgi:hypothetical protein
MHTRCHNPTFDLFQELPMEDTPELETKQRQRAALFEEAARIVRTAEAQSSLLSVQEDARVLELMERVRKLEQEIGRLKRHEQLA